MAGFSLSPYQVKKLNPITRQRILAQLPEIQKRNRRIKQLRGDETASNKMRDEEYELGGVTEHGYGPLGKIVGSYVPNYAGMGRSIAGAIGGIHYGNKAEKMEDEQDVARNSEIFDAIGGLEGQQNTPDAATEKQLRAYLGMMGVDPEDDLGLASTKDKRRHGLKTDTKGKVWSFSSDPDEMPTDTGIIEKSNYRVMKNDLTGQLIQVPTSTVGDAKVATFGGQTYTDVSNEPAGEGDMPYTFDPDMAQAPPDVQNVIAADEAGQGNQYVGAPPPGMAPPPPNPAADAMNGALGMPPQVAPPPGTGVNVGSAGDVAAAKKTAEIRAQNAQAVPSAESDALAAEAKKVGENRAAAKELLPKARLALDQFERQANTLLKHPQFKDVLGGSIVGAVPEEWDVARSAMRGALSLGGGLLPKDMGGENMKGRANAMSVLSNIKGKVYAQAYETLRGGGAITEKETERVAAAYGRLEATQDPEAYAEGIREIIAAYKEGIKKLEDAVNRPAVGPQMSDDDLVNKYLPR